MLFEGTRHPKCHIFSSSADVECAFQATSATLLVQSEKKLVCMAGKSVIWSSDGENWALHDDKISCREPQQVKIQSCSQPTVESKTETPGFWIEAAARDVSEIRVRLTVSDAKKLLQQDNWFKNVSAFQKFTEILKAPHHRPKIVAYFDAQVKNKINDEELKNLRKLCNDSNIVPIFSSKLSIMSDVKIVPEP